MGVLRLAHLNLESGGVSLVELNRVDVDIGGAQQRVAQLFMMFVINQIDDSNLSLQTN